MLIVFTWFHEYKSIVLSVVYTGHVNRYYAQDKWFEMHFQFLYIYIYIYIYIYTHTHICIYIYIYIYRERERERERESRVPLVVGCQNLLSYYWRCDVHVTVHRDKFLQIKPTR